MKASVKVDIEGLKALESWIDTTYELFEVNRQPNDLTMRIYQHCFNEARLICRRKIAGFDGQKFLRISFNEAQSCSLLRVWGQYRTEIDRANLMFLRNVMGIIHRQII